MTCGLDEVTVVVMTPEPMTIMVHNKNYEECKFESTSSAQDLHDKIHRYSRVFRRENDPCGTFDEVKISVSIVCVECFC